MSGPVVPLVLAALLVWAGSVIEQGWRVKQAEKRNPLRAMQRVHERGNG